MKLHHTYHLSRVAQPKTKRRQERGGGEARALLTSPWLKLQELDALITKHHKSFKTAPMPDLLAPSRPVPIQLPDVFGPCGDQPVPGASLPDLDFDGSPTTLSFSADQPTAESSLENRKLQAELVEYRKVVTHLRKQNRELVRENEELKKKANAGKKQRRARMDHDGLLMENYIKTYWQVAEEKTTLRQTVFDDVLGKLQGKLKNTTAAGKPLTASGIEKNLGKMIARVFGNRLQSARLGVRGDSRYHYNLERRPVVGLVAAAPVPPQ